MEPRTPPLADKRARNQRNARFRTLGIPYKACNTCFAVKPLSAYNKDGKSPDGRRGRCRPCDNAAAADWRTANRERRREYRRANADLLAEQQRKYYRANAERERERKRDYWQTETGRAVRRAGGARRRARKLGASVENFTAADTYAYWGYHLDLWGCYVCGAPIEHLDHYMPLSRGGEHSIANTRGMCAAHNLEKSARHPLEYFADKCKR